MNESTSSDAIVSQLIDGKLYSTQVSCLSQALKSEPISQNVHKEKENENEIPNFLKERMVISRSKFTPKPTLETSMPSSAGSGYQIEPIYS